MLHQLVCGFHHLGVACKDLEAETAVWLNFGYVVEGDTFEDHFQLIRGRFMIGTGPRLELLVGLSDWSPVSRMVQRGIKYYHQAFIVPNLDQAVAEMKSLRCKMTVSPIPAAAFNGRRIAFLILPNMDMIELIEDDLRTVVPDPQRIVTP